MKQVTIAGVKDFINEIEKGGLSLREEYVLACLRELVAVTEHSERVSKSLETALGVQADQAKRTNQLLGEIKKAEAVIGSLGWMGLDTAISLELTKLNKQISDLQGQVSLLTEQRDAVVAKNVEMLGVIGECKAYFISGIRNTIRPTNEGYLHMRCDTVADETPATDAAIAALRAEGVRPRIQERDLKALLRFNETCEDGEGYDIGIDAMNRLVEIGLCGKGYGGIRHITPFGQWVIDAQEGEIDSTPLRTESDVNADFSEHLARQLRESKGANHE